MYFCHNLSLLRLVQEIFHAFLPILLFFQMSQTLLNQPF
nr:MAG TPA: hypothetical protein [Caudoviricetes sp.]